MVSQADSAIIAGKPIKLKQKIMGKHYLNSLFAPKSVAVFGASDRIDSVGQIVFKNMLECGFKGLLYPINTKNATVQGQRAYAAIADIAEPIELVVIATPPQSVPGIDQARLWLDVNDERMQDGNTNQMIFPVADIVSSAV